MPFQIAVCICNVFRWIIVFYLAFVYSFELTLYNPPVMIGIEFSEEIAAI